MKSLVALGLLVAFLALSAPVSWADRDDEVQAPAHPNEIIEAP
jgi:hypothetical protein